MQRVLAPVVAGDPAPQRGEIHLDHGRAPRITLKYDPFSI